MIKYQKYEETYREERRSFFFQQMLLVQELLENEVNGIGTTVWM